MFYEKPANIISLLPEKLQSIVEFGAVGNAANPEIDNLNAAVGLMAANAFIDTVDNDGLKRWEKILGVSNPLTVYKQRVVNDPYHFEVASAKDYVYDMKISGNTIQNGTPTPDAPITPVCLPAETEFPIIEKNFFNIDQTPSDVTGVASYTVVDGKTIVVSTDSNAISRVLVPLRLNKNTDYIVSFKTHIISSTTSAQSAVVIRSGSSSGNVVLRNIAISESEVVFKSGTFNSGNYDELFLWYYVKNFAATGTIAIEFYDVQTEKGSTTTPYEPYTNPCTVVTPCDLRKVGDVADEWNPTTGKVIRKIGVKVFDGTEAIYKNDTDPSKWVYYCKAITDGINRNDGGHILCTHGVELAYPTSGVGAILYYATLSSPQVLYMNFGNVIGTNDVASFKAYLAEQYAVGTPVTVWYQLATPIETQYPPQPITPPKGVVNMLVESGNGVLPSATSLTLAEYQPDATIQARKNALKARLMTKPPINLETLRTIIEAYMGVEVEITIVNSVVSVVYRGETEVVDLSPLYATLYETIPANLLVEIAYKYLQWLELDAQLLNFDALDAKNLTWDDFERGDWIA